MSANRFRAAKSFENHPSEIGVFCRKSKTCAGATLRGDGATQASVNCKCLPEPNLLVPGVFKNSKICYENRTIRGSRRTRDDVVRNGWRLTAPARPDRRGLGAACGLTARLLP